MNKKKVLEGILEAYDSGFLEVSDVTSIIIMMFGDKK